MRPFQTVGKRSAQSGLPQESWAGMIRKTIGPSVGRQVCLIFLTEVIITVYTNQTKITVSGQRPLRQRF